MKNLIATFALVLLAAACGGKDAPAQPAAPKLGGGEPAAAKPSGQPAGLSAKAEADEVFTQRCVTCHGATGVGDGIAAASLDPKPRNYTDAAWQDSVKDEDLKKAIVGGGPAVGKSALMPPNPDLEKKPEVVDELVKKIRSFRKG